MNKWKKKFRDIAIFVLGIIFTSCVSVLAETCSTTLSAGNVTYGNNSTAQAEVSSLLTQAGNIDSRVTTLEAKDYAKRLTGEKVETRTDNEGGNIRLYSKSNTYYTEMDMFNDTKFRMYHAEVGGSGVLGSITHSVDKTANLDYLDGVTSNIQTQLNNKLAKNPTVIEMGGSSTHGGIIDFHYNNSTADYTSRIVERNGILELIASNGVKVNGNTLGTIVSYTPAAVSIASGSNYKSAGNFTLSAGTWIVVVYGRYDSNATGFRRMQVFTDSTLATSVGLVGEEDYNAVNGTYTTCRSVFITKINADTTYYVGAWQTSGSALSLQVRAYAVRVA